MAEGKSQDVRRDFVKHSFFKVTPEWRRLSLEQREHSKSQFAEVVAEFSDRITLASYSLVGTRADVDFMLWKVSPTLEAVNQLLAQLNRTELGGYLDMSHSFLSMTRRSPYVDQHQHEGQGRGHRHNAHHGPQVSDRLSIPQDP